MWSGSEENAGFRGHYYDYYYYYYTFSGHTVGYRFSHRVYPTDKLDHAVNRRLNPYAHAHSQPPASCAWGSEGSTTETKGSNIGVPE